MSAGSFNIAVEQGATYTADFQWKDGAGSPINITGYSIRSQVREVLESPETILDMTSSNGYISITNAAQGQFRITLTAAQTAALTKFSGVYDLEMVNGTIVTRLLAGSFSVSKEVTR